MSAINHGTEVPANSRREVLMGYQYALHQHRKKLREEKDEFRRSQENYSIGHGRQVLGEKTLDEMRKMKTMRWRKIVMKELRFFP
jgi:hypothetical protein